MNEHFIIKIIEALVMANLIQSFDKSRAIDVVKEKLAKELHIVWNVEDVMTQAENDGMEMDEDEAQEILEVMEHRHDCSIGMSWDVISIIIAEHEED